MSTVSEKEFPDELWEIIKDYQIEYKKHHKKKFKDVVGLIIFHKKLNESFSRNAFWDLTGQFRFHLGSFEYKYNRLTKKFFAVDIKHSPYDEIPFHKFYIFDNIGDILFHYLSGEDEHLLRKVLIYYPAIGQKNPELFNYVYNFGKKKKKKKKLSSNIKKKCKKKGIRLTYKRNGKRIYKSEKVLKKQLANRS